MLGQTRVACSQQGVDVRQPAFGVLPQGAWVIEPDALQASSASSAQVVVCRMP